MDMGHYDQFRLADCALVHAEHDCNAGRVHEVLLLVLVLAHDHADSQGRERVL